MGNSLTVQKQKKKNKKIRWGGVDKVELEEENGKDQIKGELQNAVEGKGVGNIIKTQTRDKKENRRGSLSKEEAKCHMPAKKCTFQNP